MPLASYANPHSLPRSSFKTTSGNDTSERRLKKKKRKRKNGTKIKVDPEKDDLTIEELADFITFPNKINRD